MAELIPKLSACHRFFAPGEKHFAERMRALSDNILCWYELPVGSHQRRRYTDFILLDPSSGLLVLELKAWNIDSIVGAPDPKHVTLKTRRGEINVLNPLEQARECVYLLKGQLEGDHRLIQKAGIYKGRLCFPYDYGVILSNITRAQLEKSVLADVLPKNKILCKDELTKSVSPALLQKRLTQIFEIRFKPKLTPEVVDRVRWNLFPEVRITQGVQTSLFPTTRSGDVASEIPETVKLFDMQQEVLARSLGDGHRVIHGVAGSGKTLILSYRCLYLSKVLTKPILVICYNSVLTQKLKSLTKGHKGDIQIYHFHAWCRKQLEKHQRGIPEYGPNYLEQLEVAIKSDIDQGNIATNQYDAVLIDEGHDFKSEWLRLLVKMVDPVHGSLLLLYDHAQSIYERARPLGFSMSSVGIQARGRTTVLKLNYRNTDEIITFAYRFARKFQSETFSNEIETPIVVPEKAGRHGPSPCVQIFATFEDEVLFVAKSLAERRNKNQQSWRDMCVLYPSHREGLVASQMLENQAIPIEWLATGSDRRSFSMQEDSVKIMTMHSSKGLEFQTVAVIGIGFLPLLNQEVAEAARVLYVAMTRCTEELLLTSHQPNELFSQLK